MIAGNRVIRPGPAAYYRLGAVLLVLALLWTAIWVVRGAQTGSWQVVLLLLVLLAWWTVLVRSRRVEVSDGGIACFYLARKPVTVKWRDIERSQISRWIDGSPFQIVIFGKEHATPLVKIPMALYGRADMDFLLSLPELKVQNAG